MDAKRKMIEGVPVLLVIDIQGGEGAVSDEGPSIPLMPGYDAAMTRRLRPLRCSSRPHASAGCLSCSSRKLTVAT